MIGPAQRCVLYAACALLSVQAQAGMLNGQIQARLVIMASCQVSSGTGVEDNSLSNLGLLNFGSRGPTWNTPVEALLEGGESNLKVICNPAVRGFSVSIDGGNHGNATTRQLSNGQQMIPYRLFLDAAGNNSYSIGKQHDFVVASGGHVPIPVYGMVMASPKSLPAGVYRDTLRVTLDW